VTAKPGYFLSVAAYCREFDDGAIILELASGTYLGVHAESLPDLRSRVLNWPNSKVIDEAPVPATREISEASQNLISDLLSRGILTTSQTLERFPLPTSPTAALTIAGSKAAHRRISIKHIPAFVIALITVATRHKDKKLAPLLSWIRQRQRSIRQNGRSATPDDSMRLMMSFLSLRLWFYSADKRCLFDSLVLAVFLTRRMVPCTFAIGVSTKPFLAHSWVQIGEVLLNDTAEHVQTFSPILAVGESGQAPK
jgi:hypothetical protein